METVGILHAKHLIRLKSRMGLLQTKKHQLFCFLKNRPMWNRSLPRSESNLMCLVQQTSILPGSRVMKDFPVGFLAGISHPKPLLVVIAPR